MTLLPSKELLDGTKNPETTTGEFRLAMSNIRDFLFGLSGDDSPDKWLVRETLETAEKFIAGARGTGDALTGKFTPTVRELVHGMTVMLRAHAANTKDAPALEADETPALPIVKGDKQALDAGDIAGKGHWLELKYDRIWNKRVWQNPAKGVSLKEEIDDKADKPELLDYLPLSGASMSGVLSVTSGLNVAPQDMTGLTGEGGETVRKAPVMTRISIPAISPENGVLPDRSMTIHSFSIPRPVKSFSDMPAMSKKASVWKKAYSTSFPMDRYKRTAARLAHRHLH